MTDTYLSLLKQGQLQLTKITDTPQLDAEFILQHVFDLSQAQLLVQLSQPVNNPKKISCFYRLLSQRKAGKPLAYVLGEAYFFGQRYLITPGVLIPRPETELLVERALLRLSLLSKKHSRVLILELGFGSGIISLELAARFKSGTFYAWDISKKAHQLAQKNAADRGVSSVRFIHKNFFLDEAFWRQLISQHDATLLVSNPPYIPKKDILNLDSSVRDFEPMRALNGGTSGLDFFRRIFRTLLPKDCISILCELGIHQKEPLSVLLRDLGVTDFTFYQDIHNIPRVVEIH